jgi:hypothetical protein
MNEKNRTTSVNDRIKTKMLVNILLTEQILIKCQNGRIIE